MIHPSADVQSQHIGEGTYVWQFAIILPNAVIGKDCNINCHTFIENDVVLGDRVTIKAGVYLWDGITIGDDVFIGPNATFVNDKYPRSKKYPDKFERTEIENGVSIGANATIVGPVKLGSYALIGAGSVVTKDVEAFTLVVGNPAKLVGKVDKNGRIIKNRGND